MAIETDRLVAAGVPAPKLRPSTRPYAENRGMDIECNLFDLSEHGYQDVETRAERVLPFPESAR